MRASNWLIVLRVLCLVCLGTSVALLLDYVQPAPAFCTGESGCSEVRESGFGYIPFPGGLLPVPVPVLGILAFGALFAASLSKTPENRRRRVTPIAYAIGAGALGFIALQLILGHYCWMCLTVDLAGVGIAAIAAMLSRGGGWDQHDTEARTSLIDASDFVTGAQSARVAWGDESQHFEAPNPLVKPAPLGPYRLKLWAWLALGALAVGAPALFASLSEPGGEVPGAIRALYRPGEVTVVEFFDFQCPHCRDLSPRLKKMVQGREGVGLRLGYMPLPNHALAKGAARVAICAGEQDKEREVVAQIFADNDMSLEHVTRRAKTVLDGAELDSCLASTRPDERIEHDSELLRGVGFEGLPTTYIGSTRILGAWEDARYQAAIESELQGGSSQGVSPLTFWAAMLALCVGVVLAGRNEEKG